MANQLGIGIIGAGRIGKIHAKSLSMTPGAKIAAISDVSVDAARELAESAGAAKHTPDYRDVLNDAAVDAVFICSSTDTHAQFMEEAAAAGKHIFCEKPIALDMDAIDRALAAVQRHGVLLMVGFNRRFDAGNMRLRRAVLAGEIGTPEMCVINSRDPAPPPVEYVRISGGIFLDMMIHDFDLARYLLDDEPEEVFAFGASLVDPEIGKAGDYDTAMATIRFRKGALCHIDNSRRAAYGYDQRAEVFGSQGRIFTSNIHNDNATLATATGYGQPPIRNFFLERYMDAYMAEGGIFVDCVRNGTPPPADGADGRMSVLMGHAALRSAKENRPVKIAEIVKVQ